MECSRHDAKELIYYVLYCIAISSGSVRTGKKTHRGKWTESGADERRLRQTE